MKTRFHTLEKTLGPYEAAAREFNSTSLKYVSLKFACLKISR